jgi:hypothetical protein
MTIGLAPRRLPPGILRRNATKGHVGHVFQGKRTTPWGGHLQNQSMEMAEMQHFVLFFAWFRWCAGRMTD